MSRPYKFEVHTLVTGPFRGVGVVDGNRGAASKGEKEECMVRRRLGDDRVVVEPFDENELTRASFWRWLFRRNPDGSYQIGNNNLWLWIAAMIIYGSFIWGVRGEVGPWFTAVRIIFPTFAVLYIFFTGRQYLGLTR